MTQATVTAVGVVKDKDGNIKQEFELTTEVAHTQEQDNGDHAPDSNS